MARRRWWRLGGMSERSRAPSTEWWASPLCGSGSRARVRPSGRAASTGIAPARGSRRSSARGAELRPRHRRRGLAEHLVPGAGEAALLALLRERALTVPLAPRQLVVDFEPVAVGIGEVHADGDRVVRDVDGDVLGLQLPEHLREVVEAGHPPGDMIQPHLSLLLQGGLVTHLEKSDVVRVVGIAGEKGGAHLLRPRMIEDVLGVETQDVRVPLVRASGVAHEDVDVVEGYGLEWHVSLSCGQDRTWQSV